MAGMAYRCSRVVVVLGVVLARSDRAHADYEGTNLMIGPVFGIRLGGSSTQPRSIFGVEGGVGWGPERLNLGFTRRLDKTFGYIELDPWWVVGASLGVGIDSDGKASPVLGIWEGVPVRYPGCGDTGWQTVITISVGYRYTGVHELYIAPKAGSTYEGEFCFD